MCGIAGIVRIAGPGRLPGEILRGFSKDLAHRGPDGEGWLCWMPSGSIHRGYHACEHDREGRVALVHRRLAILDLSMAAAQPMSDDTGRYHLTFNGEIYNFLELRKELEREGIRFSTRSDTEVLLTGFRVWGEALLPRLRGMFALAILDTERQTLLLARDPLGIKPLYFAQTSEFLAFASEQRPLRSLPGLGRKVDPRRVNEFLCTGLSDNGSHTFLDSVKQLPAGHLMEISLQGPAALMEPRRHTRLEPEPIDGMTRIQATDRLRELFLDSVRLHLRSDVPIGSALSGGIDSSSIVMAMRRLDPSADLHAFCYRAGKEGLDEGPFMALVGQEAEATLHETWATGEDLLDDLKGLMRAQDDPFGSTSIFAQYRVFRLAREAGIKVMLDGQGADEMLGGYLSYTGIRVASLMRQWHVIQAMKLLRTANRLPGRGGDRIPGRASQVAYAANFLLPKWTKDPLRRLAGYQPAWPDWIQATWFRERDMGPARPYEPEVRNGNLLNAQLRLTLEETSLPNLLRYEDRNSMAHGVESRVPFLDPPLVRFALGLPEAWIIDQHAVTKSIFRDAMRGLVPNAVLDRMDKIGFSTPEFDWLLRLDPWITRTLDSDVARSIPAIDPSVMRNQWEAIKVGQARFDFRIWRWVNFIHWVETTQPQFD